MKVSVAMITYNHERFIAQAIESVLMQETSFDYELVIGEDCSTDRTREIVVDFQKRFPERIRLLLPKSNLGMHENFARTFASCRGQYIALLEGDDFWTSAHKLQKQVDYLQCHPECSMCFHPVIISFPEDCDKSSYVWPENPKKVYDFEDAVKSIFSHTSSVMLRNGLLNEYPLWVHSLRFGDWPLFILHAHYGNIGCLNEVMSHYRWTGLGATRDFAGLDATEFYQETARMWEHLDSHLNQRYKRIIRPLISKHYWEVAAIYDQRGETAIARSCITQSLLSQLSCLEVPRLNSLKMLTRLCFPSTYSFSKRVMKKLLPS